MGMPFLPVRGLLGTDYMRVRPDFKAINNPYNPDEEIAVVPAIKPDVTVFHGFQADTKGNVVASNNQNNRMLAQASKIAMATVEEIVEPENLDRDRGVFIPSMFITGIVHVPMGAHPTRCRGYYSVDVDHMKIYAEMSKSDQSFEEYLQQYVKSTHDEEGYLARVRADQTKPTVAAAATSRASGS